MMDVFVEIVLLLTLVLNAFGQRFILNGPQILSFPVSFQESGFSSNAILGSQNLIPSSFRNRAITTRRSQPAMQNKAFIPGGWMTRFGAGFGVPRQRSHRGSSRNAVGHRSPLPQRPTVRVGRPLQRSRPQVVMVPRRLPVVQNRGRFDIGIVPREAIIRVNNADQGFGGRFNGGFSSNRIMFPTF